MKCPEGQDKRLTWQKSKERWNHDTMSCNYALSSDVYLGHTSVYYPCTQYTMYPSDTPNNWQRGASWTLSGKTFAKDLPLGSSPYIYSTENAEGRRVKDCNNVTRLRSWVRGLAPCAVLAVRRQKRQAVQYVRRGQEREQDNQQRELTRNGQTDREQ